MANASDGARTKVWPGAIPISNATDAGGGTGYVRNVTYNVMHDVGNDCEFQTTLRSWADLLTLRTDAMELTQCYGQSNPTLPHEYPVSAFFLIP
jgi:galacturan 1,4-alpha-galacturonidase